MNRKTLPHDSIMPPSGHQVSPERLEELRRIYKEVSGEEITAAQASEMAHRVLALYKFLSQLAFAGEYINSNGCVRRKD